MAELERMQNVIRDRITQLVRREHTALYLFGRPGTGKTHLVRTWLGQIKADHFFIDGGHVTPQGLFNTFESHPDSIIVLDDVVSLFADAKAKQYLLAAMGRQSRAGGGRTIHYTRYDDERVVSFNGGIVAISNLELTRDPRHQAIASRARPLLYDPTDQQIAGLMSQVIAKGWTSVNGDVLTSKECREVMGHVVSESRRLEARLDMRMLMDHALPDYLSWKGKCLLTNWKDLVTTAIQQQPSEFAHTPRRSRADQQAELQQLILAIEQKPGTVEDHAKEFEEQTGKTRRTYFRQKQKISPEAFEGFPRMAE